MSMDAASLQPVRALGSLEGIYRSKHAFQRIPLPVGVAITSLRRPADKSEVAFAYGSRTHRAGYPREI